MTNKKRDKNGYRKQLGRYRLNRADILVIEKILRTYADAREMQVAGVNAPSKGRKHMPRKCVDRYIAIGKYSPFYLTIGWGELGVHYSGIDWVCRKDSVKFISKYMKRSRYVELAAWPGIKVTFTPLTTTIYAQTHYATGAELASMRETISMIDNCLLNCRSARLNQISLIKVKSSS